MTTTVELIGGPYDGETHEVPNDVEPAEGDMMFAGYHAYAAVYRLVDGAFRFVRFDPLHHDD